MEKAGPHLRGRPLKDLVIPGSHDALMRSVWLPSGIPAISEVLGALGCALGAIPALLAAQGVEEVIRSGAITQGRSISGQLLQGSRYLDLRADYAPDAKGFYGSHSAIWSNYALRDAIGEIDAFCEAHPDEVVIVSLALNENGSSGTREKERAHILRQFGKKAVWPDTNAQMAQIADMSLDALKENGHQIILSDFGNNRLLNRSGIYSADAYEPKDVIRYFLDNANAMTRDRFWIWHVNPPYNFSKDSLETHAGKIFRSLHKARGLIPRHKPNIISVDFFGSHDWAKTIIGLNKA
jgi:hypothetical protein